MASKSTLKLVSLVQMAVFLLTYARPKLNLTNSMGTTGNKEFHTSQNIDRHKVTTYNALFIEKHEKSK